MLNKSITSIIHELDTLIILAVIAAIQGNSGSIINQTNVSGINIVAKRVRGILVKRNSNGKEPNVYKHNGTVPTCAASEIVKQFHGVDIIGLRTLIH